jgi:hypothetical protein
MLLDHTWQAVALASSSCVSVRSMKMIVVPRVVNPRGIFRALKSSRSITKFDAAMTLKAEDNPGLLAFL